MFQANITVSQGKCGLTCCHCCNNWDATVANLTPAITTATVDTTLKEPKTTPTVKHKVTIPRTSTGVTGKMTGKTSGPAKNTIGKKEKYSFEFLSSIQELDDSDSSFGNYGVTDPFEPSSTAESAQDNQN